MRQFFLFGLIIFIFSACNNNDIEKTKELNKHLRVNKQTVQNTEAERILKMQYANKVELQKLKNQNREKLAQIYAQKEQRIKELEVQKTKTLAASKEKEYQIEANKSITLAQIQSHQKIATKKEESSLYKTVAIIAAIILLALLAFYFINKYAKRKQETYLKEQEMHYKAYLQDSKLRHENIGKMLDIIKDKNSDKEIKKEITKLLTYNKKNLLEPPK